MATTGSTSQVPAAPVSYNRSALDAERSANRFTESGGTGVVLRFGGAVRT